MRERSSGFTLIEVLIVVVIIAVLAGMIIPRLIGQTDRVKAMGVFNILFEESRQMRLNMYRGMTLAAAQRAVSLPNPDLVHGVQYGLTFIGEERRGGFTALHSPSIGGYQRMLDVMLFGNGTQSIVVYNENPWHSHFKSFLETAGYNCTTNGQTCKIS